MGLTRIDVLKANIEHFSTPGAEFSVEGNGSNKCMYRKDYTAECPTRCGIGVVIPNELYDSRWEGDSVMEVVSKVDEIYNLFDAECFSTSSNDDDDSMNFLEVIQDRHDTHATNSRTIEYLLTGLRDLLWEEEHGTSRFS